MLALNLVQFLCMHAYREAHTQMYYIQGGRHILSTSLGQTNWIVTDFSTVSQFGHEFKTIEKLSDNANKMP